MEYLNAFSCCQKKKKTKEAADKIKTKDDDCARFLACLGFWKLNEFIKA